MLKYPAAWNTFAWFATLVTPADGLNRVGFAKWFAEAVAGHLTVVSPEAAIVILVGPFFFSHYMFAVVTTHTTAMLPVMLARGDPSGADAPTPLLWEGWAAPSLLGGGCNQSRPLRCLQ